MDCADVSGRVEVKRHIEEHVETDVVPDVRHQVESLQTGVNAKTRIERYRGRIGYLEPGSVP